MPSGVMVSLIQGIARGRAGIKLAPETMLSLKHPEQTAGEADNEVAERGKLPLRRLRSIRAWLYESFHETAGSIVALWNLVKTFLYGDFPGCRNLPR
jgi:hypothetical protein